jgi:flagellar basal-body rod protein FlgB
MFDVFSTNSLTAIEVALDGVAERQRVTAHNIANGNTPGYRSTRVEFEAELGRALDRGLGVEDVPATIVRANTPINVRGNDVDLTAEHKEMITSGIQYEALVNAMNHHFALLRTAVGR